MLRHETGEALVAALAILTTEARTAVVMAANGFSGREIAMSIGRTETATRTLMFPFGSLSDCRMLATTPTE